MTRIAAIGTTGGTITMTSAVPDGPATPAVSGEDLAAPLAQWIDDVEIRSTTLFTVGSPQLTVANVREVVDFAHRAVDEGAHGVVIVQGTDTLEEVAYLLALVGAGREVCRRPIRLRLPPGAAPAAAPPARRVGAEDPDHHGGARRRATPTVTRARRWISSTAG